MVVCYEVVCFTLVVLFFSIAALGSDAVSPFVVLGKYGDVVYSGKEDGMWSGVSIRFRDGKIIRLFQSSNKEYVKFDEGFGVVFSSSNLYFVLNRVEYGYVSDGGGKVWRGSIVILLRLNLVAF